MLNIFSVPQNGKLFGVYCMHCLLWPIVISFTELYSVRVRFNYNLYANFSIFYLSFGISSVVKSIVSSRISSFW